MQTHLKQVDKTIVCQPPTASNIQSSTANNSQIIATDTTATRKN